RHAQHDVLAAGAVLVRTATMLAVAGLVAAGIAIVDEGVDVPVGNREHAAATAPIAPVRSPLRDELLAPERHDAVAALAGQHFDSGFVDELHQILFLGPAEAARGAGR